MSLQERPGWMGIANFSESVFCAPEPRNTKFIYAVVRDYVFDELSRRKDVVRFVQVGANDGTGDDPLRRSVMQNGWQGLLIEPIPETFTRLQATYRDTPGLEFANLAISPEEGEMTFHVVEGRDALSSFSLETILRYEQKYENLRENMRELRVPTRRLDSLLRETGLHTPNVVVIDTEGCDDIVLRTYDFSVHKPDVLQLEHVHLSASAATDLRDWLTELGFALIYDRHDVLAMNKASFDRSLINFCQKLVATARAN